MGFSIGKKIKSAFRSQVNSKINNFIGKQAKKQVDSIAKKIASAAKSSQLTGVKVTGKRLPTTNLPSQKRT